MKDKKQPKFLVSLAQAEKDMPTLIHFLRQSGRDSDALHSFFESAKKMDEMAFADAVNRRDFLTRRDAERRSLVALLLGWVFPDLPRLQPDSSRKQTVARETKDVVCVVCGRTFASKSRRAKYCYQTPACNKEAARQARKKTLAN